MGRSRTLVYQLGRVYRINKVEHQVMRTEDYRRKKMIEGRKVTWQGQRVTLENLYNGKRITREQQYRDDK